MDVAAHVAVGVIDDFVQIVLVNAAIAAPLITRKPSEHGEDDAQLAPLRSQCLGVGVLSPGSSLRRNRDQLARSCASRSG